MQNNWIDTILLLTGLQAFILVTILFRKKQKPLYLIGLLALLGVLSLLKANDGIPFYLSNPHLLRSPWGMVLLVAPLTYLHFRSLINPEQHFR